MNKISFSHPYPKLHGQEQAVLLRVAIRDRKELTDKFVEYDTVFYKSGEEKDHFPLPSNKYMVLVFIGNELIPFTTVRRFTEEKYRFYRAQIGTVFDINVKK